MNIWNFQIEKLNIKQVLLKVTPFEWIIFPRKYRITPDMWVEPHGNYTEFHFLFINLKLIHFDSPSNDKK